LKNKIGREIERLKDLNKYKCILLINDINVYEIKNKLLREFNVPYWKLEDVYSSAMTKFENIIYMPIGEIKITPALVNWMLKHKLTLKDGLLINIAQRLKIPFVTSERKSEKWKQAYKGVMSQNEFWNELRKK